MDEQRWSTDRERFVRDWSDASNEGREPERDHGFPLGPLGQQFAVLTYSLLDATSVGEVLEQIVTAVSGIVPQAERVSVMLGTRDGRFEVVAEHGSNLPSVDKLQGELQEGPAVDAALIGAPSALVSRDLRAERRWGQWTPAAADIGAGAVLSMHLKAHSGADKVGAKQWPGDHPGPSGALTLYSGEPFGLDGVEADKVMLLATHASLALAAGHAGTNAEIVESQLQRAVDSRDVIGQAKGILMARREIDAGAAFDILRKTSQDLNVKLSEIAETVARRHGEI
ncbi:ANTAR domain-containing protein [Pseudonocardia nantongensis]|uniref:ANTAR domain-containing protein n=1 Tax=Pseudonocardia nantongensis TaxID=1181885 RepID=UPI00397963D8